MAGSDRHDQSSGSPRSKRRDGDLSNQPLHAEQPAGPPAGPQPPPVVEVTVGRMTPGRQAALILLVNVIVLSVALGLLHWGYDDPPDTPWLFAVLESLVIVITFLTRFTEVFGATLASVGLREYTPSRGMRKWIAFRESQPKSFFKALFTLRGTSYLAAILGFWAMWDLVANTGGGIESPFSPFLAAPAVLGPLLVMDRRVLLLLLTGAVYMVGRADKHAPHRPMAPSAQLDHPKWFTYAIVTLALVVCAGLISYLRMEPTKRDYFQRAVRWSSKRFRRGNRDAQPEPAEDTTPDLHTPEGGQASSGLLIHSRRQAA